MTDGLLENIILLEKKIQAEVSAEQARACVWQERELAILQSALAAERDHVEVRRKQRLEEKKAELMQQGESMRQAAESWCQRLQTLDDAILCDVLKQHLAAILPGGDDDHPHGEG